MVSYSLTFQVFYVAVALLGVATASLPQLVSYEPQTNVADHAAISMDQAVIEDFVGFDSEENFAAALEVYRRGGHSKSFASLTLEGGLPMAIPKGRTMVGKNNAGETVSGRALDDYPINATSIGFQYVTGESYGDHVRCQVGALPVANQVTSGCLADGIPYNTISITGLVDQITYLNIRHENGRTIAGFSTTADRRFKPGDDTDAMFFEFFQPYLTYYSDFDFANDIALAGFKADQTDFPLGNFNLRSYGFRARAEVAKKGTAYIVTGLYVLRELYDALYDCQQDCALEACNDDAVHALDEAVAFYVGSTYVTEADGLGHLFYGLAEKRAKNFGTAADVTSGQSEVNRLIMLQFNDLKDLLNQGMCVQAETNVREIVRLMQIPLIQGTIRYANIVGTASSPTEQAIAEGAIFAAGILPNVHNCSSAAAQTIYDNMKLTGSVPSTNFDDVKEAFESVYDCLRVSCEEIGGLIDITSADNSYLPGAEPCGSNSESNNSSSSSSSLSTGAVVGILIAVLIVLAVVAFFACGCSGRGSKREEFDEKQDQPEESAIA